MKTLRLGIVGCGGISHAHGNAARRLARSLRFAACCDVRPEAAEAWAQQYGAERAYTDFVEMIRKEKLDGILLATWPNQHREQIAKALVAGARHILCEKALTLTGREAVAIFDLARKQKAFLMEGFMYRHHPAISKMRDIVDSGLLGPVDSVRACFSAFDAEQDDPNDPNRNWRQRKECGGGISYDFACYAVNACGYFAGGRPARVYATGNVSPKYGTVNRLYGMIEYANGRVGIVESSKKADLSQELQVTCAHGRLNLPVSWTLYGNSTIRQWRSNGWVQYLEDTIAVPAADAYERQLKNFAGVIRGREKPVMPLEQSVMNTFVVEALVTSALKKRPVAVAIPARI